MFCHPWYKGRLSGFESHLVKTITPGLIYALSQQIKKQVLILLLFYGRIFIKKTSTTWIWDEYDWLNQTKNGTFWYFGRQYNNWYIHRIHKWRHTRNCDVIYERHSYRKFVLVCELVIVCVPYFNNELQYSAKCNLCICFSLIAKSFKVLVLSSESSYKTQCNAGYACVPLTYVTSMTKELNPFQLEIKKIRFLEKLEIIWR